MSFRDGDHCNYIEYGSQWSLFNQAKPGLKCVSLSQIGANRIKKLVSTVSSGFLLNQVSNEPHFRRSGNKILKEFGVLVIGKERGCMLLEATYFNLLFGGVKRFFTTHEQ